MARSVFPNPASSGPFTFSTRKMPPPASQPLPRGEDQLRMQIALATGKNNANPERDLQGYLERVRNYIPVEIVAFFMFVNALVTDKNLTDPTGILVDGWVAIASILVSIAACVMLVRANAQAEDVKVWKLQAVMTVISLVIWTYALDAKYLDVLKIEQVPSVSGLLLGSFTMLSGFIVPNMPTYDHDKDDGEDDEEQPADPLHVGPKITGG